MTERAINVYSVIASRVLVSRESARLLKPALTDAAKTLEGVIIVDFAGVEGVTPSFVDEMLGLTKDVIADRERVQLLAINVPTRLSTKFAAIGRGRGMMMHEQSNGVWSIRSITLPERSVETG